MSIAQQILVSQRAAPPSVVVVGTAGTLPAAIAGLHSTPGAPLIEGCVFVGRSPGSEVEAVPVLGSAAGLGEVCAQRQPSAVVVSLPAGSPDRSAIASTLAEVGIRRIDLPAMTDLLAPLRSGVDAGVVGGSPIAPIGQQPLDLADLVGRPARPIDDRRLAALLTGQRVLITGAGGSIGSELARLCARFDPSELVLMERSENALFEIDRVLREHHPSLARSAVLHDVTEEGRTLDLLMEHRPDVVFHAAAHKHVPLMEDHPAHAVINNVFGTRSIADAAVACGSKRFVMISSDKAVNPTSVMGATKRLAEMYVQSLNRDPRVRTKLSMVRFGNVLGSACSVLPIWAAQLADNRPMSVTDPRMTRYFMTIPEAASLVAQSATIGLLDADGAADNSADVFVLDMGEPVRILDLADRFARAHGLEPVIRNAAEPTVAAPGIAEIVITGARPGEKLFEELAYASEQLRETPLSGVLAWLGIDPPADMREVLRELAEVSAGADRDAVIDAIRRHVPEMRPAVAAESKVVRAA